MCLLTHSSNSLTAFVLTEHQGVKNVGKVTPHLCVITTNTARGGKWPRTTGAVIRQGQGGQIIFSLGA